MAPRDTGRTRCPRVTSTIVAVAIVFALVVVLGACGGAGAGSSEAKADRGEGAIGGRPPHALERLESDAEDLVDVVPTGRWDRVRAKTADLDATWRTYRPRAAEDGADPAQLTRLDTALVGLTGAARAQQPDRVLQGSNDVSSVVVELFGLYDVVRPVDLGRLDVVGRQIVLDAGRHDIPAAAAQVERVRSIWEGSLRARVLGHHGAAVAADMDATVAALRRAATDADVDALRKHADALLELVDTMEGLPWTAK